MSSIPLAARPPTAAGPPRIPVLDGLRAVAMLMVLSCHVGLLADWPTVPSRAGLALLWSGASGVDLFMVLSGLCLFLPLCKPSGPIGPGWDWRTFYARRAKRILPAYYGAIAFAVAFPFALAAGFRAAGLRANWPRLDPPAVYVHHLLFLQTLVPSTFGKINAAFWSMGLEVQFYLVFPLVVLACRRHLVRTLAAMMAVSVVYLAVVTRLTAGLPVESRRLFPIFFLGRWMQFAAGMAVARAISRPTGPAWSRDPWFGTAALATAVALYVAAAAAPSAGWGLVAHPILLAATFAAAAYALCATATPVRRLLETRLMVALGYVSYSIFLFHWPILYFLSQLGVKYLHLSGWRMAAFLTVAGFPAVLGVSLVSFAVLERPFLRHRERPRQAAKPPDVQVAEAIGAAS